MIINTNLNALIAGNAYANATADYTQASTRISTQQRINSAKDDPVGLGVANAFKAKIASYAKAIDNINSGISALNNADTGLSSIQTILSEMQSLAISSASSTTDTSTRADNQILFANYTSQLNLIAKTTSFNGKSLLNGDTPTLKVQTGINAGDTTTLNFGSVIASALGSGNPLALTSLGSSTSALVQGDLIINGITIRSTLATDDNKSTASNIGSAIAKAAVINESTSSTNVVAFAGATDVAGTSMSSGASGTSGTIVINGTSIAVSLTSSDYAINRAAVALAINSSNEATKVIAINNNSDKRGISLTASDGRNITISYGSALNETNTGLATADTYAGTYTLRSLDQTPITISTTTGTLANADIASGTYSSNIAQVSTKNRGAITTIPTAIAAGDLVINGYNIGATFSSDDTASDTTSANSTKTTSGIALAAAINRQSSYSKVSASANPNIVVGTGFSAGTVSHIYLNGTDISVSNPTSIDAVVTAITNANTGITATNNGSGLTLTASDGRNISIATDSTSGASIGISGLASTGATSGATAQTYISTVRLYSDSVFTVASGSSGNTNFSTLGFREGTYGGVVGDTKVSGLNISTSTGGSNALTTLSDAIDLVSSYQSVVGGLLNVMDYQTTFDSNMKTNSSIAYGNIMNYDAAAETTALAKAQIKQSAAMAMLAQANVSQDMVSYLLKQFTSGR